MREGIRSSQYHRIYTILLVLGCLSFLFGLAAYIVNGSFMRYIGDDYCYGGLLKTFGFWKTQSHSYTSSTPYHGNRFSLTLLSGIIGLFPPALHGVLPGLAIVLWLFGCYRVLASGAKILSIQVKQLELLLASTVIVFFSLHNAPDLSQSLYWRSGMLPYLAPLIVNMWMLGFVLKQSQQEQPSRRYVLLLALLAFFSAGFSETAATLQAGFLALVLIGSWILHKRGEKWASQAVLHLGVVLIATLLAMLVLILSPANQFRQADLPTPPGIVSLLSMSVKHAYIFTHATVTKLIISNTSIFTAFLLLAFHLRSRSSMPSSIHGIHFASSIILVPLLSFFLVICSMAPSAYAQSSYPELRALITARFVLVVGVAIFGVLVGHGLGEVFKPSDSNKPQILLVMGALVILVSLSPILSTKDNFAETARYQRWAQHWDARDQEIRETEKLGVKDIEVMQIGSIIPRVGGLSPNPDHWYNNCAEMYYGMLSISANKPGWGG
jgi:hypothetical protein